MSSNEAGSDRVSGGGSNDTSDNQGNASSGRGGNTNNNNNNNNRTDNIGNNNNNNNQSNRGNEQEPPKAKSNFLGRCEDIKKHACDLMPIDISSKMYADTTKEIGMYVASGGNSKYRHGAALERSMLKLKLLNPFTMEDYPDDADTNRGAVEPWKIKASLVTKQQAEFVAEAELLCGLIKGQCSDEIMALLTAESTYQEIDNEADLIGLLKLLKGIMTRAQEEECAPLVVWETKKRALKLEQRAIPTWKYFDEFKDRVEILEHAGGSCSNNIGLLEDLAREVLATEFADLGDDDRLLLIEVQKQADMAIGFLAGADDVRFGDLKSKLRADHCNCTDPDQRRNVYPQTLEAMYKRMLKHEQEYNRNKKKNNNNRPPPRGSGRGRGGRGRGRRDNLSAANFLLNAHANDSDGGETGGHQFLAPSTSDIPSSWILLDACSSIHLFCDPSMLYGIHATDRWMNIHVTHGCIEAK